MEVAEAPSDPVPGFVQTLIRDFLRGRGFEGTLRAFDFELKQSETPSPSIKTWYDMSEFLRLSELLEHNRASDTPYDTIMEVLVREMVASKLGKAPSRRDRQSMDETNTKSPRKRATLGKRRASAGLSPLRTRRKSMAELRPSDIPGYKEKQDPEEWKAAMDEHRKRQVREFQRSKAAAASLQLEQRSVTELQQEMERILGPSRQSPPRGRRKLNSPAIKSEVSKARRSARQGKLAKKSQKRKKKWRQSHRDAQAGESKSEAQSANGDYDEEEEEQSYEDDYIDRFQPEEPEVQLTQVEAMRRYLLNRSNESWIPWTMRFKMLRKDLAVQKLNNLEQANFFDLLDKNSVSLDYLSIERAKEKYSGKGKLKCALCLQPFLKVNLPMEISQKAVMDLRSQWGVGKMGRGMGLRVPACYNKVRICLYCSQYFDEEQTYRKKDGNAAGIPSEGDKLSSSFLLGNSSRRGSMSGGMNRVQVEIFTAGDGINYPKKGHYVLVHYNAYLQSGTLFDSSRSRKKPLRFRIGAQQVIKGLNDGVALLSKGERAKLTIPAHLGFGNIGLPGLVPPRSNLIYDVELMDFTEH